MLETSSGGRHAAAHRHDSSDDSSAASSKTASSPIAIPSSPFASSSQLSPPSYTLSPPLPSGSFRARLSGSSLSPSSLAVSPTQQHRARRRSSLSLSTSSSPSHSLPFGSLVGSYENSLLSGRMSTLPSIPLPFTASIGVLGSKDTPTNLKCPPHISIPFEAFFYSGLESSSPYVGTLDLESYYTSILSQPPRISPSIPKYPGYRIPEKGQLQIIIKNSISTVVKVFLIPYDLQGLNCNSKGGKTFLRQKSYSVDSSSTDSPSPSPRTSTPSKPKLRFALHLQFCSPPLHGKSKDQTPSYYLYQNIRVVFSPVRLGETKEEKLNVVSESALSWSTDATNTNEMNNGFMSFTGFGNEWERKRRIAKLLRRRSRQGIEDSDIFSALDVKDLCENTDESCQRWESLLSTPPSDSETPSLSPSLRMSRLRQSLPLLESETETDNDASESESQFVIKPASLLRAQGDRIPRSGLTASRPRIKESAGNVGNIVGRSSPQTGEDRKRKPSSRAGR